MDDITIYVIYGLNNVRLTITTAVNQSVEKVKAGFDDTLFLKLNPPFPKAKLLRFDGCRSGDIVSIELNFLLGKAQWISEITEDGEGQNEFYFVDEGKQMPSFLKYWRHRHLVHREGDKTLITDDISYRSPFILLDWLLYPLLYLQFIYRVPIYRRVFG